MLSLACMSAMSAAQAGQIIGVQQASPSPVLTEEWKNGFGGWNLDNVDVKIVNAETKEPLTTKNFNKTDGSYDAMTTGDSFVSYIYDSAVASSTKVKVANLGGKDWPVGEPSGVKVITTDAIENLSNGRPASCIMTTSFLNSEDLSKAEINLGYTGYLDTAKPAPTLCGSPYQTHKRFKVSALPASIDGSAAANAIDLVFNLDTVNAASTSETAVRRYSVLQKLNNYTGKRLSGYKIELGFGVGANFTKLDTTNATLTNNLSLSVGAGDGSDFWSSDDLATFSAGLFGAADPNHGTTDGFFSNTRAYFPVTKVDAATIQSSGSLSTNYTDLFGEWIPSTYMPKGVFYDDDNDPKTDAKLVAYWDGTEWKYGQANNFEPVPTLVLATWAGDSLYSIGNIEDLVNLGLNYMVQVGDVSVIQTESPSSNTNFTVRLIPVVSTVDSPVKTDPSTAPKSLDTYVGSSGNSIFSAYDNTSLIAMILGFLGLGAWVARRKLSK